VNILIITGTYTPSINGVAICTAIQKTELEKRGHKVWVIAPKHPKAIKEDRVIRLQSITSSKEPDYPIILPIPDKEFLNDIPRKIDLVYFQHPFLISDMAFLAAKFYKCPTVFYYHTQYDEYARQYSPKFIPHRFVTRTVNKYLVKTLNRVNHIIVGSPTFVEKLKTLRVTTPYSIIPITRQIPKLKETKKQNIALCVTRMAEVKNLHTLIKVWAKVHPANWKLVLVGNGPDKEKLQRLAQKLNLTDCQFVGQIDHENIWEYYQKASLFVFPSLTDVQPGVIFEAMFAGLPIVAFNAPGPKDFTIHKQNSFLANTNQEFTDYLKQLINNKDLRGKMGQASLLVSQKYTLEKSIDQVEQLFLKEKNHF
jgi:glycosyltransferase involved in cell wall biosynthesis